jgi:hypothetical protein
VDYDFDKLIANLESDLNASRVSSRVLLNRLCMIDENSRTTAPYLDEKYCPYYYYLGKYIPATSLMEVGFSLGLFSACFLSSCKTVEHFIGFKEEKENEFIPLNLAKTNIKKVYKKKQDYFIGQIYDENFQKILPKKISVILFNEEVDYDLHRKYFDFFWDYLDEGGLFVMDYIDRHKAAREAFADFCFGERIEPKYFKTRYGTGLVRK